MCTNERAAELIVYRICKVGIGRPPPRTTPSHSIECIALHCMCGLLCVRAHRPLKLQSRWARAIVVHAPQKPQYTRLRLRHKETINFPALHEHGPALILIAEHHVCACVIHLLTYMRNKHIIALTVAEPPIPAGGDGSDMLYERVRERVHHEPECANRPGTPIDVRFGPCWFLVGLSGRRATHI